MSQVTVKQAAAFIAWLAELGIDSRMLDGDVLRRHYRVYQRRLQDATAARYEREWQREAERAAWQSQERAWRRTTIIGGVGLSQEEMATMQRALDSP